MIHRSKDYTNQSWKDREYLKKNHLLTCYEHNHDDPLGAQSASGESWLLLGTHIPETSKQVQVSGQNTF